MIKVTIIFKDGTQETFYAKEEGQIQAGWISWVNANTNEELSYPSDAIKKVIES